MTNWSNFWKEKKCDSPVPLNICALFRGYIPKLCQWTAENVLAYCMSDSILRRISNEQRMNAFAKRHTDSDNLIRNIIWVSLNRLQAHARKSTNNRACTAIWNLHCTFSQVLSMELYTYIHVNSNKSLLCWSSNEKLTNERMRMVRCFQGYVHYFIGTLTESSDVELCSNWSEPIGIDFASEEW